MKKCYIAGKITGLTEEEVKEKFNSAKKDVEELGFIPVSPLDLKHDHDKSWESYMREDMREMLLCHAVFALKNWTSSRGAQIEINTASALGIKIFFQ